MENNHKYYFNFVIIAIWIMCLPLQAETLGEKIANSDKIYFVKLMPSKMLVQFRNYNQSSTDFTPTFSKDKIRPMEIVNFTSGTGEMKFLYEKDIDQSYVDKINSKTLEYLSGFIAKDKIEVISPENFKEEFAINSIYIQPELKDFVFIEHTNNEEFHYVSVNSFKADFGLNIYEVSDGKKKKKIVSSEGAAPIFKKSFGSNGLADNVQKTQAINALFQEYFYSLEIDFMWHLERFKKDFEKNLNK
jgi:hypothetical protein